MISSARLFLREVSTSDVPVFRELLTSQKLTEFIPIPISEDHQIEKFVELLSRDFLNEQRQRFHFVVETSENNEILGSVVIKISSTGEYSGVAELGYSLLEKAWGKGYATEMCKAMIDFGLENLHLHRIESSTVPENSASVKVLEKVGMTMEGKKNRSLLIKDKWYDELLYAYIRC